MNNFSPDGYDEIANKVIEMDKSLAHLLRDERDKLVRQELGISRAVLRELLGERDLIEFGG